MTEPSQELHEASVPSQPAPGLSRMKGIFQGHGVAILLGLLATPPAILSGVGKLAYYSTLAAGRGLATAVRAKKAPLSLANRVAPLTSEPAAAPTASSQIPSTQPALWAASMAHKARIAALQLVPIIGTQLAYQYRLTGSVQGFLNSPVVAGLLRNLGFASSSFVYGSSFRTQPSIFHLENNEKEWCESYFEHPAPSINETKNYIRTAITDEQYPHDNRVVVRIPVRQCDGSLRYHDGDLCFARDVPKSMDRPTVVLYHGNSGHRSSEDRIACEYLARGYNVLLASYAGDHVICGKGRGQGYVDKSTPCNEQAMREDAQADAEFLKALGVTRVSVFGYSLGGAQALNFAQAVGNTEGLHMDIIVLDRTFTDMGAVVENFARNFGLPQFLCRFVRDTVTMHAKAERGAPGCDRLDNVAKLREVAGKPQFQRTRYLFLGASQDRFMSVLRGKASHSNTIYSLHAALSSAAQGRAELMLSEGSHEDHTDSWKLGFFLAHLKCKPGT